MADGVCEFSQKLLPLYLELLGSCGDLPSQRRLEQLWDWWLWLSDPNEEVNVKVMLNRNCMLGMMASMVMMRRHAEDWEEGGDFHELGVETEERGWRGGGGVERLRILSKHPREFSLRELLDTVANVQLEWPTFVERLKENPHAQENVDAVLLLVDMCFARFGVLVHVGTSSLEVMDDPFAVEKDPRTGFVRLLRSCIRRTMATFLALYRHIHCLSVCRDVGVKRGKGVLRHVSKYHVEASQDEFHLLCMYLNLPVGARLNYRRDFPGMYSNISQVIFFHNSEYQRIARDPVDKIKGGAAAGSDARQVLPALWQLYPEVPVRYEDDFVDLSKGGGISATKRGWEVERARVERREERARRKKALGSEKRSILHSLIGATNKAREMTEEEKQEDLERRRREPLNEQGGWFWLMMAGRVYLVSERRNVFYSEDAASLLDLYINRENIKTLDR